MKIVTDKYLYICSIVCALLFVYFTSVYFLLVILVFLSYLYYVSCPTSSFKIRTPKQLSNLWNSSFLLTSFDSMYPQNSSATYSFNRNRTFNNLRRPSNPRSSRENDTENTPSGKYHFEYGAEGLSYRSSSEVSFSKMSSHSPSRSFNKIGRSTSPNSPWGISVSPKLRNRTPSTNTVQTVAGPLLASTRLNRTLDSGLLGNVSSPGLSSRIAHSARENAVLTHQKKYDRPGDFPLVQLDRSASRLPTLSPRNTRKLSHTSVTVRIAPPESSELRYSALLDRSPQSLGGMDDTSPTADQSTKSLLEALKEISRKRIHAQMEENKDEIKRQCKGETSLANGEQQSRLSPVPNDVSGCKRMREESPEEQNVEQIHHQLRKRINNNNNEILSSLSSSRNLMKFMKKSAKKRKSTAELLANSAPVAKKQSRYESPSEPVSVSPDDTASNSNKQNTSSAATVKSPTSSSRSIDIMVTGSPTMMHDSAKFSEIIQLSCEKSSPKFLPDDGLTRQRMKLLIDSIKNEGSATTTESASFSLSRAPTNPVRRIPIFPEARMVESTKITSDDSKTSNTEVKDCNISITKSSNSADVFGLVSSAPNTKLHNTSITSVVSVSASSSIVQTSTTQSTASATSVQNSSPFSGFTSPSLVASSLNTSLKTSADHSIATSEQPTVKTNNISPSFVTSNSASDVNAQTFPTNSPIQSSTSINFGTTQTTAAIPNSLSSVKSSTFPISSTEQPIQTSSFGLTTNAPSNETSVVQASVVPSSNKSAEMNKPSSPQLSFGAVSSAKDTIAIGSSQVQSTQATTLFSSSQVQPTQASSIFGSSPIAQSTQFVTSPQVQSTQTTITSFGSSSSIQSNPVFTVSNSSIQAITESGLTASTPSVQPTSLFTVPQTSQQTSTGGVFPSVQSSALFRTSPLSSSSSSSLLFGGSATSEAAQTSIFGSKQTDLFKTSSANLYVQAGKLFGTSSSTGVQPAQTTPLFSTSPAGTTQASVFGNSGTTQTTAGSNVFVSTSVVSSTQNEVKFGINAQSSTTLQTKPSFVLPSTSITFGSSLSPAQNTSGFQIAKSTSDSGVDTSASTASSGFGLVSSKQSPAQNTFSFGGTTPLSPASQTISIFGTPTSQVTPKPSTQTSLSFGTSTSQSSGNFSTSQTGTVTSGGFGAFSGSLTKTTTESNAVTGKNIFANATSANTAANNTPVFGTQTTNVNNVFGGTKAEEKPTPFGFGSIKPNDSSTNIFQTNTTSNQSNAGGFKFDFTSPATTKENITGTSSGQTTTPAFQFGAAGESKPAFGFGGASGNNNTLKPAASGFGSNLFGSTPNTTSSTTQQSNIFAFGGASNPSNGPASSTSNAFAFGAASSAPSTSFGSTSQPNSSNVFGFGSAQTTTTTTAGGGGLFNTGTPPAFQFGSASSQTGSTGGFGFGSSGSSATLNFTAGPSSTSSTFQPGSTGGFAFGIGSSATPVNFTAGTSSSSAFQPGTTGNMFSIGSGSTGPRARARTSRRQR